LRQAGFQINLWPYPHCYPYVLNCAPESIFSDVRVRQALNFAIDRDGLCSNAEWHGKAGIRLLSA